MSEDWTEGNANSWPKEGVTFMGLYSDGIERESRFAREKLYYQGGGGLFWNALGLACCGISLVKWRPISKGAKHDN